MPGGRERKSWVAVIFVDRLLAIFHSVNQCHLYDKPLPVLAVIAVCVFIQITQTHLDLSVCVLAYMRSLSQTYRPTPTPSHPLSDLRSGFIWKWLQQEN